LFQIVKNLLKISKMFTIPLAFFKISSTGESGDGAGDGGGIDTSSNPQSFEDLVTTNYSKKIDAGDLYITPNGNKFFLISSAVNSSTPAKIHEYSMSTNWQPSTSGTASTYVLATHSGSVKYFQAFTFNDDGTKLFAISRQYGSSAECDIWRWTLSTGFDTSTSSFDGTTRLAKSGGRAFRIESVNFNDDGSKVFMLNRKSNNSYVAKHIIYEISLNTAYDVSELSNKDISTYCDASIDLETLFSILDSYSFRFADSGKYIYMMGHYSTTEKFGAIIDISSSPYDISSVTSSNLLEYTPNSNIELYMLKPLYTSSNPKFFMDTLHSTSNIFLNSQYYVYSRQFNGTNPFSGQSVTPYYEYNIVVTQVSRYAGIAEITEIYFVDDEGAPQYLYEIKAVLGGSTSVPSGTGYSAGDEVTIPINNYQKEAQSGRLVWASPNAGVNDTLLTMKVPAYYTPSSNMAGITIYWSMQARRPAIKITDNSGTTLGTDTRGGSNTTIRPHMRTIYFTYP
jgi:hypothetical protein